MHEFKDSIEAKLKRLEQKLGFELDDPATPETPPLIEAVLNGDIAILKTLLSQIDNDINVRDGHGYTAFLHAVSLNSLPLCQTLLDYGADIHARNNNGQNALILASLSNDINLFKFVYNLPDLDINGADDGGWTGFFHAIYHGNYDIFDILFKDKNNNLARLDKMSRNAVMIAVRAKRYEMLEQLLSRQIDINQVDDWGDSALHLALHDKDLEMANYLIKHGALTNLKNKDAHSPTDLMIQLNNEVD